MIFVITILLALVIEFDAHHIFYHKESDKKQVQFIQNTKMLLWLLVVISILL